MEEILDYFPQLSSQQKDQFSRLHDLYNEWNQKINVISRKDMDLFYVHHVLHSLAIGKYIQFKAGTSILDVGTGGGFPAIPLAILFPEVNILAVDSIGKKIKVVAAIAESLQLSNLKAKHQRAEEVKGTFDFIVSRAVTRTSRFIPWVARKFKKESFNSIPNGFLFLKGGDLSEELNETSRKYEVESISNYFKSPFFETKKVVYFPA